MDEQQHYTSYFEQAFRGLGRLLDLILHFLVLALQALWRGIVWSTIKLGVGINKLHAFITWLSESPTFVKWFKRVAVVICLSGLLFIVGLLLYTHICDYQTMQVENANMAALADGYKHERDEEKRKYEKAKTSLIELIEILKIKSTEEIRRDYYLDSNLNWKRKSQLELKTR